MTRESKNTDMVKAKEDSAARALDVRRPWDLFEDMDRWLADLRSEFDRKFWGPLAPFARDSVALLAPPVDLVDEGREYVLKADLPGVAKEDLDLRVTPDAVELSAGSRQEREENEKDHAYRERTYRSFRRSLALPEEILADQAKATLKDGVLELRLPKKEPTSRPEPVKVRVE
ncbi:MAG TPA: Hsp20/alpha crystallin family protein [Thermoplasmata archaeon]|nr:Hsp20/alpha crystallin family protein [Thermoplasmata archaeon]